MAIAGPEHKFFEKWKAILLAESSIEGGVSGCRIVGLKFQKNLQQGGYPVLTVTIPGQKPRKITVARLMYMCYMRKLDLEGDASHLCHNKLCIEPLHLTLEPRSVNNSRQICNTQKYCTRKHEPYCIFP